MRNNASGTQNEVRTPIPGGHLIARPSTNEDYPGFWISFLPENEEEEIDITYIECSQKDHRGHIVVRVWNDLNASEHSDCTHKVVCNRYQGKKREEN